MIHLSEQTWRFRDTGMTFPFPTTNILMYLSGQNETLPWDLSMPTTPLTYAYDSTCCTLSNTTGATTNYTYDPGNSSINTGKTCSLYTYDDICDLHPGESRSTDKATYVDSNLHYYGYRYYSPELGRWPSRDPIGEDGGAHLMIFCLNRPMDTIDNLGLFQTVGGHGFVAKWPVSLLPGPPMGEGKACCGDVLYDKSTHCCCGGEVKSREPKATGIKRCCSWRLSDGLHCWIEWSGGSAGFYMRFHGDSDPATTEIPFPYGNPGAVYSPDSRSGGKCTEYVVSECQCDHDALLACVKGVSRNQHNDDWAVPIYNWGFFDCRHYPGWLFNSCCNQVGCEGEWPPKDTLQPR